MSKKAPATGSIGAQTRQNVAGVPEHAGGGSGRREPILADLLLAGPPKDMTLIASRKWHMAALDTLRVAKKFVLDFQAARYLGEMLREHPRIIADAQDFAIQPFNRMWIELPFKAFNNAVTECQPDLASDERIGYLFDGPVVRVGVLGQGELYGHVDAFVLGSKKFQAGLMPLEYILHRPLSLHEEIQFCEEARTSRLQLDFWFWGRSAESFIDKSNFEAEAAFNHNKNRLLIPASSVDVWDKEGLRALRANHSFRWAPFSNNGIDKHIVWQDIVTGSAGDLRNIIALLLFLNRTHDVQTVKDVGFHPAMIDRKPKTLVSHRVISLKIDPKPMFKKMVAGEGIRRRLHDVRGHFCHDKRARGGCAHGELREGDFGEFWTEYEPLKWKCSRCQGKRWWRREHSRGHFEDGMVIQQYAVTR